MASRRRGQYDSRKEGIMLLLGDRQEIERSTRVGRIGWRISVAGVVCLGLFAVQAAVTAAVTGDIPDNFVLFGLGFLLLFVGHLLMASGLRDALRRAWVLPGVGAVGVLVAITVNVDPIHDIGLFVFEGAWVALGIAQVRGEARVILAPIESVVR